MDVISREIENFKVAFDILEDGAKITVFVMKPLVAWSSILA